MDLLIKSEDEDVEWGEVALLEE
ncbi:hypothetical protein CCACVL1_14009 [Corchorus capsularis]|uniref:Uncharacterized protein n=1 Tax=Corchorus capsularis TaxID=210143 RepID=A0A1R3I8K9_COCAP|nr:hypothetical protein CCACVL1_14009 [Corchorus capsularis]